MQKPMISRRPAPAPVSQRTPHMTTAAAVLLAAVFLTGCGTKLYYPIPGKKTMEFAHAKIICQGEIANRRPAAASDGFVILGNAINFRMEQQLLLDACMLRHGWELREK